MNLIKCVALIPNLNTIVHANKYIRLQQKIRLKYFSRNKKMIPKLTGRFKF